MLRPKWKVHMLADLCGEREVTVTVKAISPIWAKRIARRSMNRVGYNVSRVIFVARERG